MPYGLKARADDMIEPRPTDRPELDTLLTFEVSSGARFGSWRTRDDAERVRGQLLAAWRSGLNITGTMEFSDVTLRSAAIIAVYLAPEDAPHQGVTNRAGGTT